MKLRASAVVAMMMLIFIVHAAAHQVEGAAQADALPVQLRLVAENPDDPRAQRVAVKHAAAADQHLALEPDVLLDESHIRSLLLTKREGVHPVANMRFTESGSRRFEALTGEHIGRRIAVVFNGAVIAAPVIRRQVRDAVDINGGVDFGAENIDALYVAVNPQPAWRIPFDERYAVPRDRALRHIPPPFIPERQEFMEGQTTPTYMVISWGVSPFIEKRWVSGEGVGMTLRDVLIHVLHVHPHEFDGPIDLLELELPGDWSVQIFAPRQQAMDELAARLREITGRDLRFVRGTVHKEVVVVSGTPAPPPQHAGARVWEVSAELPGAKCVWRMGVAGGRTEMLEDLRRTTRWAFLDETKLPDVVPALRPAPTRLAPKPLAREQIGPLIKSLSEQTGLKVTVEQRELRVWNLVEEPWAQASVR